MVLPLSSTSGSDLLYGLQSASLNAKVSGISSNVNDSNSAYYAKKGEPMYLEEMDADDDGVVSFDEFRDYCKENNISAKQMVNMVDMANNYRTLQANEKVSQSIGHKETNTSPINFIEYTPNTENVYATRGDSKYDEVMDTNSDDKITYEEYINYCKEHAKPEEKKADTKIEQTEDGTFKTSSVSKALKAYAASEAAPAEGKYEEVA